MTAHRSLVRCPRCHAGIGAPCTASAVTLHTLDGSGAIVHAARTVLEGYAHTLARANTAAGDGVTVWLDCGAGWHPDGRVSLGAFGCGQLVRPYTWHPYRHTVTDNYSGQVVAVEVSGIAAARMAAAGAYLAELDRTGVTA